MWCKLDPACTTQAQLLSNNERVHDTRLRIFGFKIVGQKILAVVFNHASPLVLVLLTPGWLTSCRYTSVDESDFDELDAHEVSAEEPATADRLFASLIQAFGLGPSVEEL